MSIKTIYTTVVFLFIMVLQSTGTHNMCHGELWSDASKGISKTEDVWAEHFAIADSNLYMLAFNKSRNTYELYLQKRDIWHRLSNFSPIDSPVHDMIGYRGEIYVGGSWEDVRGMTDASGLIKWDGSQWVSVSKIRMNTLRVRCLGTYNNELIVGGFIPQMDTVPMKNIAAFDGTTWSNMNGGISNNNIELPLCMEEMNGILYVGGRMNEHILQYDGATWDTLAGYVDRPVESMAVLDNKLMCYGPGIIKWGNLGSKDLAFWDGSTWLDGNLNDFDDRIICKTFQTFNDQIYALAEYSKIDGSEADGLIIYDGNDWYFGSGFTDNYCTDASVFEGQLYITKRNAASCHDSITSISVLDSNSKGSLSGFAYVDYDTNCIYDQERIKRNQGIHIIETDQFVYSQDNGFYRVNLNPGQYTIRLDIDSLYDEECSAVDTINIYAGGNTQVEHGFNPYRTDPDVKLQLYSRGRVRPGDRLWYNIYYSNIGATIPSGKIHLNFDSRLKFHSSSQTAVSSSSTTVSWDYQDLVFDEFNSINVYFDVPTSMNIGDIFKADAFIEHLIDEKVLKNNKSFTSDIVSNSYDPNDKRVWPQGVDGMIDHETHKLRYMIRFQNTGNDTAWVVRLEDEIDLNLDLASLKVIDASHPYEMSLDESRILNWTFLDIGLTDSATNVELSQGFVLYEINIKDAATIGTTITNMAGIYFDYNEAIYTNTASVTLADVTSLEDRTPSKQTNGVMAVYPNPADDLINISADGLSTVAVYSIQGELLQHSTFQSRKSLDISEYSNGMYFYQITTGERKQSGKFIVQH